MAQRNRFRLRAMLGFSVLASACASAPHAHRRTPAALAPLSVAPRNEPLPARQKDPDEAVVHVVSVGAGCSGVVIDEWLVLTAHHCIVVRDKSGHILDEDQPPSQIQVEIGEGAGPEEGAGVRAVLAPPCGYRGGSGDLAILVLDRSLARIPPLRTRTAGLPHPGELIEPIGYGRCSARTGPIHRVRRAGGPIERIDLDTLSATASICPGDSGGPARSLVSGDVVGVISASVMDDDETTRDETTFTRLDVWRNLFEAAHKLATGSGGPARPTGPGASCADARPSPR